MTTAIYRCLEKINNAIADNKTFLSDLDGAIGDADHGINMARGFGEVIAQVPQDEEDISIVLKKVGMVLISKVGGASGPLYGTAFIKAAGAVNGKRVLDLDDIIALLEACLNGIKMRGKATVGEKTMVDAIEPALSALKEGKEKGKSIGECIELACKAAEEGVEYTKTIRATKGRASYLGDRSIGHQDPGATSSMIIFKAIKKFYTDEIE